MNMKSKDVYPDMTYADNMPRKDHEKYARSMGRNSGQ